MFDFPIPINDRILGAYYHRSCYGGVSADHQRFLSADADQASIFVSAAYCNGFHLKSVGGVARVQRHGTRLSRQS
jgi:hypothetical protein